MAGEWHEDSRDYVHWVSVGTRASQRLHMLQESMGLPDTDERVIRTKEVLHQAYVNKHRVIVSADGDGDGDVGEL